MPDPHGDDTQTEHSTISALGKLGAVDTAGLIAKLREEHTREETPYHSWRHILHGLSLLFDYRTDIPEFDAALIAWLNHDRIYDARKSDNEERSAELARQMCLDFGREDLADLAVELVLDTRHEANPRTETGKWIVGIDLAILGECPERYDEYEANIRREYAHVPDAMYRLGRRQVLGRFAEMDRIYDVLELRERFEQRAKSNLKRALSAL